MHKQIKQSISFFFLFLLLFPLAEKAIHALEHHDEVQCSITDKHFHEQEHQCSICDFTITDSNGLPCNDVQFVSTSLLISFTEFIQSVNIPFAFSDLPSRAPPIA